LDTFAATIGETIFTLFADSQRVGIRRYEDGGSAEIANRLTPLVNELLVRGCDVLAQVISRYEVPGGDDASIDRDFDEDMFTPVPSVVKSPTAVTCDIAFMAKAELRHHQNRLLMHRPDGDAQEMISECGSALRGIQKSLYAVEPRLCELERLPRFLPSHLETSLQVRRHYRKLWNFALVIGDVDASSVRAALRGAGTRISILAGSEIYSLLREDDRFYIRELQLRILDWLRDGTDPGAAIRIWQDFALFVEILRQVNLREELLGHDHDVIVSAADELLARGEDALPEVLKQVRAILGVDDALDEVILGNPSAKSLLRELRRAAEQFGGLPGESSQARSMAL
jgi:hypothetical protein